MFPRMTAAERIPRQWAIEGFPESGKSTFLAQMQGPILVIDADQRFVQVLSHATAEILRLSEHPPDNVDVRRIVELLTAHVPGSGIRTIGVDSVTAILGPLVARAILDNDAGLNKNRSAAFKEKAMALRLLEDVITGFGLDVLWIWHLREARDAKGQPTIATSVSNIELMRFRRVLNVILRIVADGTRRGIKVVWARSGRSGMTIWDDSGCWRGMAEKIEAAVYGGLTAADRAALEKAVPSVFATPQDAIAWAFERGAFRDMLHAQNAYLKVKREQRPRTSAEMREMWVAEVERRVAEATAQPTTDDAAPADGEGEVTDALPL